MRDPVEQALRSLVRPVRLLAAGGTIAMSGERAVPALGADELIAALPALRTVPELRAENVLALPGPQISLADALDLAQRAAAAAGAGDGVVITTGTDTLEELAVLCALLYAGGADGAPIVLTGANRPANSPGADGPANLLDAVALAGAGAAAGLGVLVVFGGEIHAAMTVRKVDSTGPGAFGSPGAGPIGRVVEGRVWLHARPHRRPATARAGDARAPRRDRHRRAGRRRLAAASGGRRFRRRWSWSHSGPATCPRGCSGAARSRTSGSRSWSRAARTARRCCSRPTASRAPSATCAPVAQSACRSCQRRQRGRAALLPRGRAVARRDRDCAGAVRRSATLAGRVP